MNHNDLDIMLGYFFDYGTQITDDFSVRYTFFILFGDEGTTELDDDTSHHAPAKKLTFMSMPTKHRIQ